MKDVCRFKFQEGVSDAFIESQVYLALKKVAQLFGETTVWFGTSYLVSGGKVVIDITNEIGQQTAKEFVELMISKVGRDKFTMKRGYIKA